METKIVSDNRAALMGIATIMILIGHSVFYGNGYVSYGFFNDIFTLGYSGVDIFLFLSGFGLYFSRSKNDTLSFCKRRVKRILPATICIVLFFLLIHFEDIGVTYLNPLFWFQNYWYLGFSFFSYLIFPVIFNSIKAHPYRIFALSIIISIILLIPFILKDQAQSTAFTCFITRIPVFVLGAVFASEYAKKIFDDRILYVSFILGILSLVPYKLNDDLGGNRIFNTYYSILLITPPLVLFFTKIINGHRLLKRILSQIGKYSLEIYLIQVTIMPFLFKKMIAMDIAPFIVVSSSFIFVFAISYLMFIIDSIIQKYIL